MNFECSTYRIRKDYISSRGHDSTFLIQLQKDYNVFRKGLRIYLVLKQEKVLQLTTINYENIHFLSSWKYKMEVTMIGIHKNKLRNC